MGTKSTRAKAGKYKTVSEAKKEEEKEKGTFKPNETPPKTGDPVADAKSAAKKDDDEKRKKELEGSSLLQAMEGFEGFDSE